MDDSTKEIAYLILQHKYIQSRGIDANSEEVVLKHFNELFPEHWNETDIDRKIELIGQAIKNDVDLLSLIDKDNGEKGIIV